MKKTYISPAIRVKHIEVQNDLLQSSSMTIDQTVGSGNGSDNDAKRGIQFGDFGSAKSTIDWDDEE